MQISFNSCSDFVRERNTVTSLQVDGDNSILTPRVYRPIDPNSQTPPAPHQICTPISYYLTLFYLDHLVWQGIFHEVGLDDLPPLSDDYKAKFWRNKFFNSKYTGTLWKLISITKVELFWYGYLFIANVG